VMMGQSKPQSFKARLH